MVKVGSIIMVCERALRYLPEMFSDTLYYMVAEIKGDDYICYPCTDAYLSVCLKKDDFTFVK